MACRNKNRALAGALFVCVVYGARVGSGGSVTAEVGVTKGSLLISEYRISI